MCDESESAETKIIKNHRRRERGKARDPKIVHLALESRASRGGSSVLFPNSGRLFSSSSLSLFFVDARVVSPQIQKRGRRQAAKKNKTKKMRNGKRQAREYAGSNKTTQRERVVANSSANSRDGNIRARAKRERDVLSFSSGGVGERVLCVKVTIGIRSFYVSLV